MAARFLIDGYNLLHAVGLPARLGQATLHHARQRLVELIRQTHPEADVTIVFDARRPPRGVPREQAFAGVRIVFAHGSADDLIVEMLEHDAVPRSLCVVTNDRAVQEAARRRGATVLESMTFLDAVSPALPTAPPSALPPTSTLEKPTGTADNRHWLETFADIDDEEDVRRMQQIDPLNPDPDKVKKHRSRRKDDE